MAENITSKQNWLSGSTKKLLSINQWHYYELCTETGKHKNRSLTFAYKDLFWGRMLDALKQKTPSHIDFKLQNGTKECSLVKAFQISWLVEVQYIERSCSLQTNFIALLITVRTLARPGLVSTQISTLQVFLLRSFTYHLNF